MAAHTPSPSKQHIYKKCTKTVDFQKKSNKNKQARTRDNVKTAQWYSSRRRRHRRRRRRRRRRPRRACRPRRPRRPRGQPTIRCPEPHPQTSSYNQARIEHANRRKRKTDPDSQHQRTKNNDNITNRLKKNTGICRKDQTKQRTRTPSTTQTNDSYGNSIADTHHSSESPRGS